MWVWYRFQNRIEKYYHHDRKQLTFYQKVHTGWEKKKCSRNLCIAISSNLFDKKRIRDNFKCHIQYEGSWIRWIVIEQVNYK